jgi:hypothetical protein
MKQVVQRLNGHAYLLLEVEPGASNEVANQLVELNRAAVPYAAAVWGPWDVVARVTLKNLGELLKFVDDLRIKTENRIIRTETWCIRSDQEQLASIENSDQLAFVMLRVDPGHGRLINVLNYVCEPSTSSDGAKVLHAAGVLGPYDIATTVGYRSDAALTNLVMNRFQERGRRLGIKDTLTIPSIAGMLYPENNRRPKSLSQEARELATFRADFETSFPAAAGEVEQARLCYAHGLGTACVFHLMRATEVGLNAVLASLKIENPTRDAGRNWGAILKQIRDEIDQRNKKTPSGWVDPKEKKFFSSVHATLSAFKTSWRNPTMHHEYSYSGDEAKEVFNSVRNFMNAVASHMDQNGQPAK